MIVESSYLIGEEKTVTVKTGFPAHKVLLENNRVYAIPLRVKDAEALPFLHSQR